MKDEESFITIIEPSIPELLKKENECWYLRYEDLADVVRWWFKKDPESLLRLDALAATLHSMILEGADSLIEDNKKAKLLCEVLKQ